MVVDYHSIVNAFFVKSLQACVSGQSLDWPTITHPQRSSCGFPVRADSRAASRISITCTLSRAETGSSMGLLLRMQSTKYEIGLLVSFGSGSSVTLSPSGGTFGSRASLERRSRVLCRASRLPFGPNTSATSLLYGQSQEASMTAVASG